MVGACAWVKGELQKQLRRLKSINRKYRANMSVQKIRRSKSKELNKLSDPSPTGTPASSEDEEEAVINKHKLPYCTNINHKKPEKI